MADSHPIAARQSDIRSFSRIGKAGLARTIPEKSACDAQRLGDDRDLKKYRDDTHEQPRKRRRMNEEQSVSDEEERRDARKPERKLSKLESTKQQPISCNPGPIEHRTMPHEPIQLPTPETTPTKPARFHDATLLKTPSKSLSLHETDLSTPPPTPRNEEEVYRSDEDPADLPDEIQDLIQLHAAFLKAISLHFAHHGTTGPINLQTFTPSVSKIWGRRAVTELDIRRTLGIMRIAESAKYSSGEHNNSLRLELYDYGRGRLCMERSNVSQQRLVIARHIEEDLLNEVFEGELQKSWARWTYSRSSQEEGAGSVIEFIHQLPVTAMTPHPSLSKVAPLFTEGLRRLSSIKNLAAASAQQTISTTKTTVRDAKTATTGIKSRNQSLLDRIKAKEALQSTLPAAPTKEALDRKAALHRLPDVISMLTLLCPSTSTNQTIISKRQTFSMQSLVQRIQDSSRSSLSREEVENCLRLLAEDIAQGWVKIVSTGGSVLGVVIGGGVKPSDEVLEARRKEALLL